MSLSSFRSSSNGAEWELGVYHCDSLLFPNEDCDDDTTDNDDELNLDAPWVKLVTVGGGVAAGDASHVRVAFSFTSWRWRKVVEQKSEFPQPTPTFLLNLCSD